MFRENNISHLKQKIHLDSKKATEYSFDIDLSNYFVMVYESC